MRNPSCTISRYLTIYRLYATRPNKKDIPLNRVSLGWFGHKNFQQTRDGLENLRSNFTLKFGSVDNVNHGMICATPIITFENRVVSKAEHVPIDAPDVSMDKAWDPKGILYNNLLKGSRNRLVKDNIVSFYSLQSGTNGYAYLTCHAVYI